MSTIYEIFGRDAHAMTIALMERAEVITAIPAGASVALKPNWWWLASRSTVPPPTPASSPAPSSTCGSTG